MSSYRITHFTLTVCLFLFISPYNFALVSNEYSSSNNETLLSRGLNKTQTTNTRDPVIQFFLNTTYIGSANNQLTTLNQNILYLSSADVPSRKNMRHN